MSQNIEQKLMDMKKKVEKAKTEVAQAQGAIEQLNKRMKEEFGVDNIDDAEDLLTKIQKEGEDLAEEIREKMAALESNYDWS